MRKGIKEKDIRDFVKYANKLSEVGKRIKGAGFMAIDMGAITLYGKDNEPVETVYVDNIDTGYL